MLLLVFSLAHSSRSFAAPPQPDATKNNVVAGEFVIKFKPDSPASEKAAIAQSIGGELSAGVPQLGVELITVATLRNNPDVNAAADTLSALQASPAVEYAEPNYIYTLNDEPVHATAITSKTFLPMAVYIARFLPNDPSRGSQYAWDRISAFEGWFLNKGSANVVIAIVDTGIQPNHPDLHAKLVPGYDFIDNDTNPADGNGHGTHVAGTAAAMTNNAIGGAGTCPECRLMAIRVLDNSGSGTTVGVANGIIHAANSGAKVINLSLGGPGSTTLENSVNYAWGKGSLLACAAGNSGTSDTTNAHPAAYANCLAVGATESDDDDAPYSNWGLWVDIAAPGTGIFSTWIGSGYNTINGTSMATPHVAGVAGLLTSQGLNNVQSRARLQSTADPIDGTGLWWSNGRLNMLRAVRGS
jgi:subtilisin family serine protease